ncbi:oxidoreductase-like protein [Rhypophila decipiens]|uniref:Oxidoreductase-like protein n=1 Tax=Rhypophila decipiens TaxID=261697 RepID=A0AAN6Y074_9PEZI|nr:oxidoreductase-like protein [Rhypophila decipiens]
MRKVVLCRLESGLWNGYALIATKANRGPQYVVQAIDREMGSNVHTCIVPISDYELIVTRDPANVQAMLATQAADWDVGEHRNASWRPLFGDGVFTCRGEAWRHSRALVRPQFGKDQINDLDLIERHVQQLFSAIDRSFPKSEKGWTPNFDLQPLLYRMTLDITTELIYGYSAHSQNPAERSALPSIHGLDEPDRETIGTHMDGGKAWAEIRGALWKYRWLLPTRKFKEHCAAVHKYAEWFVQLRLQRGDSYLDGIQSETGAVSRPRYILLDELAKVTQDPVELRSQTLNVLTAGRDTTAALVAWIFYLLARHPGVFSKLREQVLAVFGPYRVPSNIEYKELRDEIPYMSSVINETLRVAPVIPLNERVSLRDTTLPRGGGVDGTEPVFVPKGQQVLIPTYAMARRKDIWGEDVYRFVPERWEGKGGRKFGFEFIPFGGGVRQCLGQQLARTEAAYVVARILQRYDKLENVETPPHAPMQFHHTIENRSGTGTLKGHKLLIVTAVGAPAAYLQKLKTEFPDLEIDTHILNGRFLNKPQEVDQVPPEKWKDVTILVTFNVLPTPEQAPKLEYVQLFSAGVNHIIKLPIFTDTEISFCTANGVHGPQITEWIVTTYLAFEHHIPDYLEQQKQQKWHRISYDVEDAVAKTVGILGYGSIGRQLARVTTALGMKVHAYTLHPRKTPESKRDLSWTPEGLGDPEGKLPSKWYSGGSKEDLHQFLASGLDLLVIATPLTDNTQHLISAPEFQVLAKQAEERGKKTYIANIARGPVINTDDLIDALNQDLIRGAALDVTDPEPLPDGHPLWSTKNAIITPHVSGASTAYNDRVLAILEYNLGRLSKGKKLTNLVNRKEGY